MPTIQLDGERINSWEAFHAECQREFGFPDYYSHTMDAWVDCLSYLRDEEGMTRFLLDADETLRIEILHADILKQKTPEILEELAFCVEAINERYEDYGEKPALNLVLL